MRRGLLVALWLGTGLVSAQTPPPDYEVIGRLTSGLRRSGNAPTAVGPIITEGPRINRARDGFIESIGAPPGHYFAVTNPVPGSAAETARNFLNEQRHLFGVSNTAIDFRSVKVKISPNRKHVRFQETYATIPIFAAELIVQLSAEDGVEAVHTSMARDLKSVDEGVVPLTPKMALNEARQRVRNMLKDELGVTDLTIETPALTLFVPGVLREPGPIKLVWDMKVSDTAGLEGANIRVLLDASSGEIIRRYPLIHHALNRQISDANSTASDPGTFVRGEGQPACNIADADNSYAFLGDTYNYYSLYHNRDSINGAGSVLNSTVRFCSPNPSPAPPTCPMSGSASYNAATLRMYFGVGFVTDDIAAHELTHGVTSVESQLIYANESGAINESLSDVFGEFIDITNGSADDTPANRWLLGETSVSGVFRSMKNPPAYGNNPDRRNHPGYIPATPNPTPSNDFGGVHSNSGVNNKLCYLLVDGDTFNGQTIQPTSRVRISQLYYEAQVNLLTSSSGWDALFEALQQAAINLGWNVSDRNNLYRAMVAVEIARPGLNQWVDKNATCVAATGAPTCASPPIQAGPYKTISHAQATAWPGDILHVRSGTYGENITLNKILTIYAENGAVTIGQ